MKRSLPFLSMGCVMVATMRLCAQPVLTYLNDAPLVGSQFQVLSGPGLDPGTPGSNAVYDLQAFAADDTTWAHFTVNSGTPLGCAGFDTVNMMGYDVCLRLVDTALYAYRCGYYVGIAPLAGYDGRLLLKFPFSFNDVVYDGWSDVMTIDPNCTGPDLNYSDMLDADGYGSLVTPFGTFGPVLRIHTITTLYAPGPTVSSESYRFFLPGTRYPVAEIRRGNDFGPADSTWTTRLVDPTTVGLESVTSPHRNTVLYPVPTSDEVAFRSSRTSQPVVVEILDAQGRSVLTIGKVMPEQAIDVSMIPAGSYLLRLRSAQGDTEHLRFIKIDRT